MRIVRNNADRGGQVMEEHLDTKAVIQELYQLIAEGIKTAVITPIRHVELLTEFRLLITLGDYSKYMIQVTPAGVEAIAQVAPQTGIGSVPPINADPIMERLAAANPESDPKETKCPVYLKFDDTNEFAHCRERGVHVQHRMQIRKEDRKRQWHIEIAGESFFAVWPPVDVNEEEESSDADWRS